METQRNREGWQVEKFGGGIQYGRNIWKWDDHRWNIVIFIVLVIAYIAWLLLLPPLEWWSDPKVDEVGKWQRLGYGTLLETFLSWDLYLRLLLMNLDQNDPKVPGIVCYCLLDRISITLFPGLLPQRVLYLIIFNLVITLYSLQGNQRWTGTGLGWGGHWDQLWGLF